MQFAIGCVTVVKSNLFILGKTVIILMYYSYQVKTLLAAQETFPIRHFAKSQNAMYKFLLKVEDHLERCLQLPRRRFEVIS